MRATIRLYSDFDKGAAGYLAYQLDDLNRFGFGGEPCECVEIRINSVGGFVTEGLGMYGSIIASELPCNTYVDGVAMSMGMVVAQAGKKRYMASHAICMMHPVQPGKDSDPDAIEKMNASILDILAKRATCSKDEIASMIDKTTYLDAQECLDLGLIDEIFDLIPESEMEPMQSEDTDMDHRCQAVMHATNKFISKSLHTNMETVAKAKYDELATNLANVEAKAKTDLDAANKRADDATNKLAEVEGKLVKLEATNKELDDQRATDLIDAAEAAGKFKSDAKNTWLEKAKADYDGTKALLDTIGVNRQAPDVDDAKNRGELPGYSAAAVMAEINQKTNK